MVCRNTDEERTMKVWVMIVLSLGCYQARVNHDLSKSTECPKESMVPTAVTETGVPVEPGIMNRSGKFLVSCQNPPGEFECVQNSEAKFDCNPRNKEDEVFDAKLHESYAAEGTASVKGQAFLKTRGGNVKYGAGEEVLLIPKTPYFEAFVRSSLLGFKRTLDDQAGKVLRTKTSNGQGEFMFEKLPAGEYIVMTQVYWEVPSGEGGMRTTGGIVLGTVTISDGEAAEVVLK
jgi:hypothetical protein